MTQAVTLAPYAAPQTQVSPPSVQTKLNVAEEALSSLLARLEGITGRLRPEPASIGKSPPLGQSPNIPIPELAEDIGRRVCKCHDEVQKIEQILFL